MSRIAKETLEQYKAFLFYHEMGDERAHEGVAERFKVSIATIKRWSTMWNWVERVKQQDELIKQTYQKQYAGEIKKNIANTVKGVNYALGIALKDIATGKLKAKNIADVERLAKLQLLLTGNVTERTGISIEDKEKAEKALLAMMGIKD